MGALASLPDTDPELVSGVAESDLPLARRALTRPVYEIPTGRWTPDLLRGHGDGAFGVLVISGVIIRQIDVASRQCTQLLGSGDVLQPAPVDGLLRCPVTWTALERSGVVVLDDRFMLAAQRWPVIGTNLYRRLLAQNDRCALHAAITRLPRVEDRLLALFWLLAERWGRVTRAGIEVRLHLTHEALGRLVGAKRPTVTLALRELSDESVLTRSDGGAWVLDPGSEAALRPSVTGQYAAGQGTPA